MPEYFDPNLIPRSLDSIYNAHIGQQQRQRQQGADLLSTGGIDPGQVTPQNYQAANSGAMPGEDPIIGAIRSHIERKKQAQGLETRNTESQIGFRDAQAEAIRRGQVYFDTASGRQMNVPAGAKPLPVNPNAGRDGKMLPPTNVMALNEGKSVARMLPDVETALQQSENIMGPMQGRVGGANPYDERSQTVDARFRTASQAFGRFMEGGVLRKEDEEKYRKMFPQLSDQPQVAKNKLSIVRRMLAEKYEDDRGTLGKSGYDVSGFEQLSIPASIFDAPQGGGKIRVSNGRETLLIDPSDEADAAKDGFRRAQ